MRNHVLTTIFILLYFLPLEIETAKENAHVSVSEKIDPTITREIVLHDVSNVKGLMGEGETLRQVFRIVDLHYLQRERLDVVQMLSAGIAALATHLNIDVEATKDAIVFTNEKSQLVSSICIESKKVTIACENKQKGVQSEFLTVRFAARGFYSTNSPSEGVRFLESFTRVVLWEISKATQMSFSKLMQVYLNGILEELDPHSSFLNAEDYRELRRGTRGQFGGVGLILDEIGELATVREVVPGSPASKDGVEPGDVVLRVENNITAFQSSESVARIIRADGSAHDKIVWFYRPSSGSIIKTTLRRQEIPLKSVEAKQIFNRPDVLHLRVTSFSSQTADDIYAAYQKIINKGNSNIKYMVLDLRGNPGGLLDQAIRVADLFLPKGKIVSVHSRYEDQVEQATQSPKIDLPLVIIVNAGSASASEIVAGALKDHKRALVVGERTFGKGSVQSLFELPSGEALKLTMASYFTPSGRSIQSLGVTPDVKIKLVQFRESEMLMSGGSERDREEDLAYAFKNPNLEGKKFEEGEYFGDGHTPVVWCFARHSLMNEDLNWGDYSYPLVDFHKKFIDLNDDAFLRVGVSLADDMLQAQNQIYVDDKSFSLFVERQKQIESKILSSKLQDGSNKVFTRALGKFFVPEVSVKNIGFVKNGLLPFQPVLPLHSKEVTPVCCESSEYSFKVDRGELSALGESVLVGIRANQRPDDPVVWVKAFTREEEGVVVGQFAVPDSFRFFLSRQNVSAQSSVSFFLKENMFAPGIFLGKLPYKNSASSLNDLDESARVSISKKTSVYKNGVFFETLTANIKLSHPVRSGTYHLVLYPLGDKRLSIQNKVISLKTEIQGSLTGTFSLQLLETRSSGENFAGVVGSLLIAPNGELVGKWPLLMVAEKEGRMQILDVLGAPKDALLKAANLPD